MEYKFAIDSKKIESKITINKKYLEVIDGYQDIFNKYNIDKNIINSILEDRIKIILDEKIKKISTDIFHNFNMKNNYKIVQRGDFFEKSIFEQFNQNVESEAISVMVGEKSYEEYSHRPAGLSYKSNKTEVRYHEFYHASEIKSGILPLPNFEINILNHEISQGNGEYDNFSLPWGYKRHYEYRGKFKNIQEWINQIIIKKKIFAYEAVGNFLFKRLNISFSDLTNLEIELFLTDMVKRTKKGNWLIRRKNGAYSTFPMDNELGEMLIKNETNITSSKF